MKRLLCTMLFFLPLGGAAEELVRYVPDLVGESKFFDARMMSRATASQIAARFPGEVPIISAVPGEKNLYVVSAFRGDSAADYGRRVFLVRFDGPRFESLYEGRAAGDSYIQNPYYFLGRDVVILVVEEGTEYTWGHAVYLLDRRTRAIRHLGELDVAKEDGETYDTPMPEARVFVSPGGAIEFRFYTDLIKDPGGSDERELAKRGEYISFVYDGKGFMQRVPSSRK